MKIRKLKEWVCVPYVKNRHMSHFIDKIVRDVRKLFVLNCSLHDAILWNRSQISRKHN